jgi:hypothetical protein
VDGVFHDSHLIRRITAGAVESPANLPGAKKLP